MSESPVEKFLIWILFADILVQGGQNTAQESAFALSIFHILDADGLKSTV